MTARFFEVPPFSVPERIARDFHKVKTALPEEIAAIDRVFGSTETLVPFYITPDAQTTNPADFPEDNSGLTPRQNIFTLLDGFLSGDPRFSHALILSDAGMGKTSLLVILRIAAMAKLVKPAYNVVLLKLSASSIDHIKEQRDPANTILLLDALDEDPAAWDNLYTRLQEVMQSTQHFRKTVITCRTQFFPDKYEERGRVDGQVTLTGFTCSKVFLSPFTDEQVKAYLEKRFGDTNERLAATAIIQRMKYLKFRPMLLSHVDLLLDRHEVFHRVFDLYAALVDEWINRELRKEGSRIDKRALFDACVAIAVDMYRTKARFLERFRLEEICASLDSRRTLDQMTIEGRSLLQKTSEDKYKFAHFTIMEYFVTCGLLREPDPIRTSDQVKQFLADNIMAGRLRRLANLDLTKLALTGLGTKGIEGSSAMLDDAVFLNCVISYSAFNRASLKHTRFRGCDVSYCNLSEADLDGATFTDCDLTKVLLRRANCFGAAITECNMSGADVTGTRFERARVVNIQLGPMRWEEVKFDHCSIGDTTFSEGEVIACSFIGAKLNNVQFEVCRVRETTFASGTIESCGFPHAILDRVSFNEAKFEAGTSFDGVRGDGTTFVGASLRGVTLRGASLKGADLSNADLTGCQFQNAHLEKSNLNNATGAGTVFDRANLEGADLQGTSFSGARFNKARMSKADLREAMCPDGQFSQADLSEANCRGATLASGMFVRTDFTNANLEDASLARSKLASATLKRANMRGVDLTGADLSGNDLTSVQLTGAKLFEANLTRCRGTSFRALDLTRAVCRQGKFVGADFDEATLKGTDLSDADLSGAQMRKVNAEGARFQQARMRGAVLERANLTKADLCGCDLTDAKVTGALFSRTVFDSATILPALDRSQQAGLIHRDKLITEVTPEGPAGLPAKDSRAP